VDVDNWMDFFTYTDLSIVTAIPVADVSTRFCSLGRSMSYMLREEAFHMALA